MYLKALKNDMPEGERKRIYSNLLEYCHMDTLADVRLLEELYRIVE